MSAAGARAWRARPRLLLGLAVLLLCAVAAAVPPIPQDPAYHGFADRRACLGVPNCLNVGSSLPFLLVGARGLVVLARRPRGAGAGQASDTLAAEPWPDWLFFAGVALTGAGSAYYHWRPDSTTLAWDRLPMTLAFMALLASVIGERVDRRAGTRWLLPLAALGVGSVLYWHLGEQRGVGDLRPYALVQFGGLVLVVLIVALFPAHDGNAPGFGGALGWYALGKVFEQLDHHVFALVGVSGHTLKHLASALAAYWILRRLERRRLPPPTLRS